MKANKAPEKLYFNTGDIYGILDIYSNKDPDDSIEYVRKDTFIEKACEYWYQYNRDIVKRRCSEFTVHVEDFRKYLED